MEGLDSKNCIFFNQILVSFLPYQTNSQVTWAVSEKEGEAVVPVGKGLENQKYVDDLPLPPGD